MLLDLFWYYPAFSLPYAGMVSFLVFQKFISLFIFKPLPYKNSNKKLHNILFTVETDNF